MKADIKVWWKQAERDLKSAQNSLVSKDYYVSALLSQQAVEKALKFLYLREKGELLRIHDVVKLAREVNAPLEIVKKCAEINPVYVEVRYPEGKELPADKVSKDDGKTFKFCTRGIIMDKKTDLVKSLKRFAEEISDEIKVDKMYFFGSRATGKAKKWSDVDLLLVSKNFVGKRKLRRAPPLYMKWNLNYPVDFICLTPKEFQVKKNEIGVVQEAVKKGIKIK